MWCDFFLVLGFIILCWLVGCGLIYYKLELFLFDLVLVCKFVYIIDYIDKSIVMFYF